MKRQGDVLVIPIKKAELAEMARAGTEGADTVLAHGEVTGHRHRFRAESTELWAPNTGKIEHAKRLLAKVNGTLDDAPGELLIGEARLAKADALVHEEHSAIEHEAGVYQVRRQREYRPGAIQIVAD